MVRQAFSISEQQQQVIDQLIATGRFASADEVVRRGLDLVALQELEKHKLREMIEEGYQQALRGELIDGDQVFEELRRRQAEKTG